MRLTVSYPQVCQSAHPSVVLLRSKCSHQQLHRNLSRVQYQECHRPWGNVTFLVVWQSAARAEHPVKAKMQTATEMRVKMEMRKVTSVVPPVEGRLLPARRMQMQAVVKQVRRVAQQPRVRMYLRVHKVCHRWVNHRMVRLEALDKMADPDMLQLFPDIPCILVLLRTMHLPLG